MRSIPVSPDVVLLGTGKAAAQGAYAELSNGERRRIPGEQGKNAEGVPMWTVDVLYLDPEGDRAEVCGVKVASWDQPRTDVGKPVKFVGLVAVPYVQQGTNRVALSFRAEGIEGQAAPKAA
ncbi:hypothetical protein [Pseudonocardia oroxyli]|uniref:Single-stranded DNA-binding protein n=1 Tax=Pseudonocardia oroxyli TaxID=366584 RepID=A0A1G7UN87_PSEOR|nr:hypothetical protein [Pseudonocardia oroxyli]SDG48569.1 hypothetical protein SAMN05216377_11288 [Pseudonocardia oroxyli]